MLARFTSPGPLRAAIGSRVIREERFQRESRAYEKEGREGITRNQKSPVTKEGPLTRGRPEAFNP